MVGILDFASGNTAPEATCGTFVLESRPWWDNLPVGIKPLFSLWAAQMERERKMCFYDVPQFLSWSVTPHWSNR